ncbi:AAA family ATPase [Arthrobacter sp. H20]|uniref:AAA family ATPase n=1 Tax=Arthrobacter sp. H20 TaxID=1267981 RepID=UPI000684515C|nr:AAA family ATPase [Arthrobacter sp. H20]
MTAIAPGVILDPGSHLEGRSRQDNAIDRGEATFTDLLQALGHDGTEHVTIAWSAPEGNFRQQTMTAAAAPAFVEALPVGTNVWYSVNAMRPSGSRSAADATRWTSLWADLDVATNIKQNGLPGFDVAYAVIKVLSGMLATRPAVIVSSGHGLQPLWLIDPTDPAADLTTESARTVATDSLKGWGRLVKQVVEDHGGKADNVFDLPRLLRAPGTVNTKPGMEPVPATAVLDAGQPLTITGIVDVLGLFAPQPGAPALSAGTVAAHIDVAAYEAMTPERRAALDSYVSAAVRAIIDELRASKSWLIGHTDAQGRGWEKLQADAANKLARFARANWNGYTLADACRDFDAAAPTDQLWTARQVREKFDAQAYRREPVPMPALHAQASTPFATYGAQAPGPPKPLTDAARHAASTPAGAVKPDAPGTHREVILTPAAEIKPLPVFWLWEGRLALGTLGLLAGRQGLGKSTLAYWLAARITRGDLPGQFAGTPKSVLVCATEDSWEHTIVPRLIASGADLERVYRIEVHADHIHVGLSLPRDNHAVGRAASESDAALLLLDPLISRLGDLDTHRDSEVRQALEPLVSVASRSNMAVLGLIHHNKSGSGDPLQSVMGSTAFSAVARSVHTVIPDPDDETENRKLFGTPKNNLGRTNLPTLAFTVESFPVPTDHGDAWTGYIKWGEEHNGTISEAMGRAARNGSDDDKTAIQDAADWLEDFLTMEGPEVESAIVKDRARKAGHSESTLKRARTKLRVVSRSSGFPRTSKWSLPDKAAVRSQPVPKPWGEELTELTEPTGVQSAQLVQSVPVRDELNPLSLPTAHNLQNGAERCRLHARPKPDACYTCAEKVRTQPTSKEKTS